MKIGILCAGDEELAPFLPLISNCKITEKAMLKFHAGQIDSVEVVALFSGRISDFMDIRDGRSFRCRLMVVHRWTAP